MPMMFGYFWLCLAVCLKCCMCHHGRPFPPYWSLRRVSMFGAVLYTSETRNMYQCQRLCWVTSPCVSVTFSTSTRLCSLYTDIPGDNDITVSRTDITSFALRDADKMWKGSCRHSTCPDGTACVSSITNRVCLFAAVSCGLPSSVANADVTYTTMTYNSTVTYSCHTGYNFQGSNHEAVCSGDATWKGFDGQCNIVSCGVPTDISNADVTYTTTTYNSTAVYWCHTGYNFQGPSQDALCAEDGQWARFNGSCQIVSCGVPPNIDDADVTYTTMTYNSTALYKCHTGYSFQGTILEILCAEDGLWRGFSGTCNIVSCGAPTTLANGDVLYTTMTYNSTASYSCNTGYTFQGTNQESQCAEDGLWAGINGSCLLISCGTPSSAENADVSYTTMTYNSTAMYSCHTGYDFHGTSHESLCAEDGQWSGLNGTCLIVSCGVPGSISNAVVTYTEMTYNSTATYTCHTGYNFHGTRQETVCAEDGQWEVLNGQCDVASCGVPALLNNADLTYSNTTYNFTAQYTCHPGYNFQGISHQSVCTEDEQWTGLNGTCQIVSCGAPANVDNADVTYTTVTYNSTATYNCHTGFNLQGTNQEVMCAEDGQWTEFNGSCLVVSCGTPNNIVNADVTYTTMTYNSTAVYNCHTGYNFSGISQNALCTEDGNWTGLSGQCDIVICGAPASLADADVTYTTMTYNSTATYGCHIGYNFQGTSQEALCAEDGMWTGLSGKCQVVSCGIPDTLLNAVVTYSTMTYNSTATYGCQLGYNFQGINQEALCDEDGQWSGFSGSCVIVTCGTPGAVANADVTYTTMTYTSTATSSCKIGYSFQGSSQISTCGTNGQWAGFSGSCDIVSCDVPDVISNGDVTYPNVTYNSTASYRCDTGYHFQSVGPDSDITCEANGQWSSLPGTCDNIRDCSDILAANIAAPDDVYVILPTVGTGTINVFCDMTNNGGGWTVIQRRSDGSEDFWRYWTEYKQGFGSLTNEFWLGNRAIHRITSQQTYQIRFDLMDFSNNEAYALYSDFYIENENQNFRLQVSGYSGNAGDSFEHYHDGMDFSTRDSDNDNIGSNCAIIMPGGWWYNGCLESNLNGQYSNVGYSTGVNWQTWKGFHYSLKTTVMKIRPQ